MKININDFSKAGLVDIVRAVEDSFVIPEELFARLLRMDLIRRVNAVKKELDILLPKIDAQRPTLTSKSPKQKIQAYNRMVDRYNRMKKSGLDKIKKIEDIDAEWPELKIGGPIGEKRKAVEIEI